MENGAKGRKLVEQEVAKARKRLLDLTFRNRLISFRPTKASTIEVLDAQPESIFEWLVVDGRVTKFKASAAKPNQEQEPAQCLTRHDNSDVDVEDDEADASYEESERGLGTFSGKLQTSLTPKELDKRLRAISEKAHTVFQEQGYNVLYLALGFLEWFESEDGSPLKAPLVLVPVELERKSVYLAHKLTWDGEDISTNVSLHEKLLEQSVELPSIDQLESEADLNAYLDEVREAVRMKKHWRVTTEVALGFFTYAKFIMWKDLDPDVRQGQDAIGAHQLLASLFSADAGDSESDEDVIDRQELTNRVNHLKGADNFNVVDADPSQLEVIELAKTGRNLVVEGPPGTGKSQTITNLIGELLAQDKKVLFISAKMAALEVVYKRLRECGLADACLELHSHKVNKREVIKELKRTAEATSPGREDLSDLFSAHDERVESLEEYAAALRQDIGSAGLTVYEAYGLREFALTHLHDINPDLAPKLATPDEITHVVYASTRRELGDAAEKATGLLPINTNPWYVCSPELIQPTDLHEVTNSIAQALSTLDRLGKELSVLRDRCGLGTANTLGETRSALEAAVVLSESPGIEQSVLLSPEWNHPSTDAQRLVNEAEALLQVRTKLEGLFLPSAINVTVSATLAELAGYSRRFFRIFMPGWYSIQRNVRALYQDSKPKSLSLQLNNLTELAEFQQRTVSLDTQHSLGTSLFGHRWKGIDSRFDELRWFSDWLVRFRSNILMGWLEQRAVEMASRGTEGPPVQPMVESLDALVNSVEKILNELGSKLSAFSGTRFSDIPCRQLAEVLTGWLSAIDSLPRWSQWIQQQEIVEATFAKPVLQSCIQNEIPVSQWAALLDLSFANALLRVAFFKSPALSRFAAQAHEHKIADFQQLDKDLIRRNQRRLAGQLSARRPSLMYVASPNSEAGILRGEFQKQRRLRPIRKLLTDAGQLIQRLKPCFMMGPMSVAQFLSTGGINFDVVIIDEGSQLRPEEALGAILRARQLIVMGDTKQLPPTSFFDRLLESDSDEEEEDDAGTGGTTIAELESILHQCARSYPQLKLSWHYRSRHESLIAVSNQQFYENSLLVYPSPESHPKDMGLSLVRIEGGVYDRSKSRTNEKEARTVAQAVIKHFLQQSQKPPAQRLSLGVGTLSMAQQDRIQKEIENLRLQHPQLVEFFDESRLDGFFVKNLETIQGDERDVIFVSIGYGPDSSGKLHMSFGPINADGGWRRLNVLMTRARQQCIIYASFRSTDLRVSQDSKEGVRALKAFMEYAETGAFSEYSHSNRGADSDFEVAVYEFLRGLGHEVDKQVGCAGYFIDLALVDPESPGTYLLAIECDGAKYHSPMPARARDRLRQQVLESRGWGVYRVWSTEWYLHRRSCEQQLVQAIQNALVARQNRDNQPEGQFSPLATDCRDDKHCGGETAADEVSAAQNSFGTQAATRIASTAYTECELSRLADGRRYIDFSQSTDITAVPTTVLAQAVTTVVDVESPVHIDEVVTRIRDAYGYNRAGNRIRAAVENAVRTAHSKGSIKKKLDFLWLPAMTVPPVRNRSKPKIQYICSEEIFEAAKLVLKQQFATESQELAMQVSRVMGFQVTHAETLGQILLTLTKAVKSGDLVLDQSSRRLSLP